MATWLTFYLGRPVSEAEVLTVALRTMAERNQDGTAGLTLLSLRHALAHFGVAAQGYRVSLESLLEYFDRGGLPVLLHVTRPESHFVLAVGVAGDQVVLADPSFGRRRIAPDELVREKGFQGIILVSLLESDEVSAVRERQHAVLDNAGRHLARLERLRDVMLR